MKTQSSLLTIIAYLLLAFNLQAQEIKIDGVLDESSWQEASISTENYQVSPQTLIQNNQNFSYQLISTKDGIFLGLLAKTKSALRIRTQENDSVFTNDHFQLMLDVKNHGQQSYVFGVNHQGNYFDGTYDLDKQLDLDWDAQWEYKVKVNSSSWIAEIFIPWQAMSFAVKAQNQFGLYISRYDENSNATYASVPVNQSMNSFLQQFTKLTTQIASVSSFDLFPYVSVNRDMLQNANNSSAGIELFWQPSKHQRLSATVNPDFGQVESDELVVNFSAIENFFSEKRPFFNDNQSLFDVTGPETLTLVHTPRIGGNAFYDDEYISELDAALKYTVNINNFDLGILSAFENSKTNGDGRDFHSLRGQYTFGANKLGLSFNQVDTPTINRQATVISSDLHLAISEDMSLNFGLVKSSIELSNNKEQDMGWWITGSVDISDQHTHEFSLFTYGDNLQLNDIGFVKRVNRKQVEYEYQYQIPDLDSSFIREMTFAFETEFKTNFQQENLPHVFGGGIEIQTVDEFEYDISIELISAGFDDLITRGNRSLWLPSSQNIEFELSSAEYLWGQYELAATFGIEGIEGYFYALQASVSQQFNENMLISFSIFQYNSDSWLDWDEDNKVDEFNFTEQGIEVSVDYQIADNQELRIKFETIIGKANSLNSFIIGADSELLSESKSDDFSFAENAFQLRYKYSLSKLTAFYLSYGFGGEYEDEVAKFGQRNLYQRAIKSKNAHNFFAKLRLHF